MKKKVILIGIIILIIGATLSAITYLNKPKILNLSSDELSIKNQLITELISTVNTNNYDQYEKLVFNDLKSKDDFTKLQKSLNHFGKLEKLTFEHTVEVKKYTILVCSGDFTNEKNIEFTVAMNKEDKIAGFHLK